MTTAPSAAQQRFTPPPGVTGSAFQPSSSTSTSTSTNTTTNTPGAVPLDKLQPVPETISCPNCHKVTQTRVHGRSPGKERFMNVFWWPLPGRRHWFEKTQWFCENCDHELATQKHGKDVVVGEKKLKK